MSRAAILVAARKLFADAGYAATSVSDIVSEAGTSVGLPYYHFGNKRAIFLAIWNEYQQAQRARTAEAVASALGEGKSDIELLLAGQRAYLEGAWANRDILPLVHGPGHPEGFESIMSDGAEWWYDRTLALLPGFDPEMAALAFVMLGGALSSVCLALASCRTRRRALELIDQTIAFARSLLSVVPRAA